MLTESWDASQQRSLEATLAAHEGAQDAVALASDLAALHAVFFTFLAPGDHVIVSDVIHGRVRRLVATTLTERYGVEASFVDASRVSDVVSALRPSTRLVHVETIGNPTLQLADIAAIAAVTHGNGALLSVDSTLTPPPLYRPLADGADLVVHSLTTYIDGHRDVHGGAVAGDRRLIDRVRTQALAEVGGVISPFTAWLIARGAETLPLRLSQYQRSAQAVAEYLAADARVARVSYPGLRSHPQHAMATRQFGRRGHGGVVSFALAGDAETHRRFLGGLRVVGPASHGRDTSLIAYLEADGAASWPQSFREHGVLRLTVGLDDEGELIADLGAALDALPQPA
jgi:cystathionine beta-lyase/cystathionine gamma-synthase